MKNGRTRIAAAATSALMAVSMLSWGAGCGQMGEKPAPPEKHSEVQTPVSTRPQAPRSPAEETRTVLVERPPVVVSEKTPTVVANAAMREAIRQDSTWTPENIQKNPYLFVQDQIRRCDDLKAKIEAQNISMVRLGKQAERSIQEADAMTERYNRFLAEAKTAYKEAEKTGKWPVVISGYELDEEHLGDRIADALERIELAKKDRAAGEVIVRKTTARQGILKAKGRELASLRLQLVQQGEQVKMNAQLAEINELANVLGVMKDMMLEIEEDPTQPTVDDLAASDPDAARKRAIRAFLDD